ncbi:MAG: hypothetical protein D6785_12045, partial [Planctomycetota bacterium]
MNPLHRIYGIETEYPIIFIPEKGSSKPSHTYIFDILSSVIEEDSFSLVSCLPSRIFKDGYFLSNGAHIHYEAQIEHIQRGLVEFSTPECLSPKEVLTYHYALDQLMKKAVPKVEKKLSESGYFGKLIIGKNNTDQKGNYYGCHESYLVREPLSLVQKALLVGLVAFFILFALPFLFVGFLPFLLYLGLFGFITFFAFLCERLENLPLFGEFLNKTSLTLDSLKWDFQDWLYKKNIPLFYAIILQKILKPSILLYSYILSLFLFPKHQKYLTGHLVTRQIFTGNGYLNIGKNSINYEISQRAKSIDKIFQVYWDDQVRPIFDVKEFLVFPLRIFRAYKRMHIISGDSNLSLESNFLKIGTTSLIIGMIEKGHTFPGGELANPIEAMHLISEDLFLTKRFAMKNGESKTALEIQKYYLEEAKSFYGNQKIQSFEVNEILKVWEETLQALEEQNYEFLGERLDYWMKKEMIEHALWGKPNWEDIGRALPILHRLEERLSKEGDFDWTKEMVHKVFSPEEWDEWCRLLEKESYSWDFILECYEVYYQILQIDLQFHELSDDGLFFQFYVPTPELRISPEMVEYVLENPPGYTRAALRGKIVSLFHNKYSSVKVSWNGCTFHGKPNHYLWWDDPFRHTFNKKEKEILEKKCAEIDKQYLLEYIE